MPPRIWVPPNVAGKAARDASHTKHLTPQIRRSEALSLYREILRTAKHFHWADDKTGRPWNSILKEQARQEFEAARTEEDPLIIARMLITGRDCVQQIQTKFNDATQAAWKRIETDNTSNNRKR